MKGPGEIRRRKLAKEWRCGMARSMGKQRMVTHEPRDYDSDGELILTEEERSVAFLIGRAREKQKRPLLPSSPRPPTTASEIQRRLMSPRPSLPSAAESQPELEDSPDTVEQAGSGGFASIVNPWLHFNNRIVWRLKQSRASNIPFATSGTDRIVEFVSRTATPSVDTRLPTARA